MFANALLGDRKATRIRLIFLSKRQRCANQRHLPTAGWLILAVVLVAIYGSFWLGCRGNTSQVFDVFVPGGTRNQLKVESQPAATFGECSLHLGAVYFWIDTSARPSEFESLLGSVQLGFVNYADTPLALKIRVQVRDREGKLKCASSRICDLNADDFKGPFGVPRTLAITLSWQSKPPVQDRYNVEIEITSERGEVERLQIPVTRIQEHL
jgi:hypothetical protein